MPLRVALVDDHPVFRAGLRALIEQTDDLIVAGEAGSAGEAVERAAEWAADVVVMDVGLPDGDGLDATRAITAGHPATGVLVLTMHDDDETVFAALRAGARGYAVKGSDEEDILRAVRAVARGDALFGAGVADRMVAHFTGAPGRAERAFPALSPRERQVLEALAQGASNGAIAQQLGLTVKTVRNHVASICNKLQVVDRAQAALRARDAGLGG